MTTGNYGYTNPLSQRLNQRTVSIGRDLAGRGEPGLNLLSGGEETKNMLNGLQTKPRAVPLDLFLSQGSARLRKVSSDTLENIITACSRCLRTAIADRLLATFVSATCPPAQVAGPRALRGSSCPHAKDFARDSQL